MNISVSWNGLSNIEMNCNKLGSCLPAGLVGAGISMLSGISSSKKLNWSILESLLWVHIASVIPLITLVYHFVTDIDILNWSCKWCGIGFWDVMTAHLSRSSSDHSNPLHLSRRYFLGAFHSRRNSDNRAGPDAHHLGTVLYQHCY